MKEEFSLPLVSIIITSYNRASMISKAIESALMQDYPNLEIIISDNCSTDDSDKVISSYLGDPRVKYSRNDVNIGMIPNFRKATYDLATGEYLTYISSDDYLTDKNFVSDAISITIMHPDVEIVHARASFNSTSNGVLWDMPEEPYFKKEIWDGKDVFFKSIETGLLSWGACLLKKSAMERVSGLKNEYHNVDLEANYKIMLDSNVGFINRLCYMQIGHFDNNGFPANAGKLVLSLECFESVAKYAIEKLPERTKDIIKWKEHFLIYTINIGFHSLIERNIEQYRIFKNEVKSIYPYLYKRYTAGWTYRKMILLQPIKKIFPPKVRTNIRKLMGI